MIQGFPDFSIVVSKFENIELPSNSFDLIYSASAFHWISEEIGYKKVYELLKKGGVFARFSNVPYLDKGNLALSKEIQDIYKKYEEPKEYTIEDTMARAYIVISINVKNIEQYKPYRNSGFCRAYLVKKLSFICYTQGMYSSLLQHIRQSS